MLYYLYSIFGVNIFQYLSFRAGLAFIISFCLCVFLFPKFIIWARNKKASQPISSSLPTHKIKANTPTMGGVVFVSSSVIASILCANFINHYVLFGVFTLILFCLIGVRDDYIKISQKNNQGISAKRKIVLLIIASLILSLCLFLIEHNSNLYLPFIKKPIIDMGCFTIIFWLIVFISSSNAVNITDGLDGLATVPSICAITTLSIFVYFAGNAIFSSYLLLPKTINSGELFIVSLALLGSLFGFLWYNCYPAQVFMGDSGSLALGGFIAYMGIVSNNEILLILVGFIFVIETLSVILQIGSYKIRNKKIFLMAPIHHHFEVKGWSENKIIIRFWIIALLSNLLALLSLKIR
ncbi:phospho-N-acetylmuramoyl-pentapeptide-transferase [Helicobacter sp. MIT 14-3879]|uniref:phospho-N-acetylmuramoyl-pentapeptide- transferase n=1 Tax=Helicobacter sp. MIT 14-3879 TaxID=2040649 RepID=UPI000E1E2BDA|nr:phospho-N-acetylmuramoyl-pentapeptide-transferase [Helicobacter sp. MIT 14-3879]RDU60930.1 phospho-N-acetylmuramoyl-pentapeptide-transferase [Helicobacter sp. MIT 14-3879]